MTDSSPNKNTQDNIKLKLGDIILINSPNDSNLDQKKFLIKYLSNKKIILLGKNTKPITLLIDENNNLENESIQSITIINRNKFDSYAKQNNLLPNQWIDIYFNTDTPAIITGIITNLDEDQIEIKLISGETIYIDFGYMGIPQDLPIEKIVLRDPPSITGNEELEKILEEDFTESKEEINEEIMDEFEQPVLYEDRLKEEILDANDIQFGELLETVPMEVQVPESEKRYSIEQQTTDMLNELLSDIPNQLRTPSVLNNIHKMIERYKLLRQDYSSFDMYGQASKPIQKGANHKPLIKELNEFNQKLYWILPVVKNIKKLYDICCISADQIRELYSDVSPEYIAETRIQETDIFNEFTGNQRPAGQNAYELFIKSLNKYWTPYIDINNNDSIISTKQVNTNICAVVDNLNNFESSIAKGGMNFNIKKKRFLLQEYNLGINTFILKKIQGGKNIINKIPITLPDKLNIKSFLTLPSSAVLFSKINLPSSNILTRCNLSFNFINYWKLLNKSTNISLKQTNKEELEFNKLNYLNQVSEYFPNPDSGLAYDDYLNNIIPKTRVIFDIFKENIENPFSIFKVVSFLEPFLIYHQDLTFKQYENMSEFIEYKINLWKRMYEQKKKYFYSLLTNKSEIISPLLFSMFLGFPDTEENIKSNYSLQKYFNNNFSNSEFIKIINEIDYGIYFNNVVTSLNLPLLTKNDAPLINKIPSDYSKLENNKCNTKILAKKYIELDELSNDNGKDIYFDKNLDKTYYEIIDEYNSELDKIPSYQDKMDFLVKNLMNNTGMSVDQADREAEALLNGYKKVKEGDYATLTQEDKTYFYIRKDNTWVKDETIDPNLNLNDNTIFCNLSNKCISINDDCLDLKDAKNKINKDVMKEINKEFDDILKLNSENIDELIINNLNNSQSRINLLISLQNSKFLKYNNYKYSLGLTKTDQLNINSPNSKLLSSILKQSDFVKKQSDIHKFVSLFTRTAYDYENKWWLYCNVSNAKLLPTFISKLASVYIEDPANYNQELDIIKSEQGQVNEADIIDKYTGWYIDSIQLSTEEGYDEQGFVIKTRDILKEDLSNKIGQSISQPLLTSIKDFDNPDTQKIYNVMTSISKFLGINSEPMQNFVISQTIKYLAQVMPSEDQYNEIVQKALEKGKKRDSYEIVFNQNLIIITISFLLVGLQTNVPPIKTKKTFPGCKKSFDGYPTFGNTNKSGLEYIVCVTNKIKKSPNQPWNSIKKLKEQTISSKMEKFIDTIIIPSEIFKQKQENIIDYKNNNKDEFIPNVHKIEKWDTFLPSLRSTNFSIDPLSNTFKTSLIKNINSGNKAQFNQINAIRAKIIYTSLVIQQDIQKIINDNLSQNNAILSNNSEIPFLENACCYDNNDNTYNYFANKNNNINIQSLIIKELGATLEDIGNIGTAAILFDPQDTRVNYPELPPGFSEETIYKAFIIYCKYNSNIPLNENLRLVCMEKPDDFDIKLSMSEKIKLLKNNNIKYDNNQLLNLMNIVNEENIVDVKTRTLNFSNIQKMRIHLEDLKNKNQDLISEEFQNLMIEYLDRFGTIEKDSESSRNLKDYLFTQNKELFNNIKNFQTKNSSLNKRNTNKFIDCLKDLTNFEENNDNTEIFTMSNFIKNTFCLFSKVYPNIIINSVDYEDIPIPKHWNLSPIHNEDVKNQAKMHFKPLVKFYNDKTLINLLQYFQNNTYILSELINNTILLLPNNNIEFIFDQSLIKLLFNYYILTLINHLISLIDKQEIYENIEKDDVQEVDIEISPTDSSLLEIISGNKKDISTKVSDLISNFLEIICNDKKSINLNYTQLMEKVTRSSEKEKDMIVEFLTNLTDEQREVENIFKIFRLGDWSVGLQKGYREYDPDTYDKERKNIEDRTLLEKKINKTDNVTEGLMDMYILEAQDDMDIQNQIENEELNMNDPLGVGFNGEDDNIDDERYDDEY